MVVATDCLNQSKVPLSGRILNVTTSLPNKLIKKVSRDGSESWEVQPVIGNSALYSSYSFLDQDTDWETHLIAWTGEIQTEVAYRRPEDDDSLYLDDQDKSNLERMLCEANKSDNIHPVWLLRKDQSRWRKYAENVLWTILHYIQAHPSDGQAETTWWHDYVKFNEAYLNKIKQIYKPGDIIWIHDYYLLLLPQLIRSEFPSAIIGFFLHVPFPSSEYFRCLSKRSQILDGILCADKISFQSESFKDHFISCCSRVLGYEVSGDSVQVYGSKVLVEALPIGIDAKKIEQDCFFSKEVEEKAAAIRDVYGNMKIIVGRDRLDSVRGVYQKFKAYEVFLEMYPEWRKKVVLIQVSSPCFSHSKKYAEKLTELVNHINNKFGGLHWTPIEYFQKRINKNEYLALLKVADLALITSARDAMNTTSLEFVICQKEKHSPLVLSEFTGTVSVLKDVTLVNPWDPVGVAKTIYDSFSMTDNEKKVLEMKLYENVLSNTVQTWTSLFIASLVAHINTSHHRTVTPILDRPLILKNYLKANKRLFLFDYDGTLTPIVTDPAAAIPSSRLNAILDLLASDPRNDIWIISGRDQKFLDKWFGKKHVGLSAEHGCFMRDIGKKEWVNLAATFDMSWQSKVQSIYSYYTERTPGTHIETKKVALTWHYRRADPQLGAFQASNLVKELKDTIAKEYDVEVMTGKANIEVRPKFVNKGEIAKRLVLGRLGNSSSEKSEAQMKDKTLPSFTMCLGDDLTDEDMFKSLSVIEQGWKDEGLAHNEFGSYGVYTVVVGPASKKTLAKSHLTDPGEVLETLGLLAGKVSLFESAGTVELDDRGHLENSAQSKKSKSAILEAKLSRTHSTNKNGSVPNGKS